jgi:peptidoglycan/LPS O-acetylase OafA/YrhL
VITHVIRWFMGDPDGPILLFYALFPSIFGLLAFMAMRWKGGWMLFAITCAVTAGTNQVATFIGQRGFDLAGGMFWGIVSIIIGFLGGLIWGPLGRALGIGLEKAGVPAVDEPPGLTGGRAQTYA